MEFISEYGMFLLKAVTIVVAIIIVITAIASTGSKQRKSGKKGVIKVTPLNDHFEEMKEILRDTILQKEELKQVHKIEKKNHKAEQKEIKAKLKKAAAIEKDPDEDSSAENERKKRVYVLNFDGDMAAEAVTSLREEITAILTLAEESDEVLLRLESPGGQVHAYGLASSQLLRIKNKNIPLTICVDKVAASGGYMMACLADHLVAAPFAYLGSIGVVLQLPNIHRALKKHDIDYEMISAGEYKRTITQFGEITEKGRKKAQEDVENLHGLFKSWVKDHRPSVDIDKIATGEAWVGMQAKERYMIDEIKTSDECIVDACESADVYEVEYEVRKSMQEKLSFALQAASGKIFSNWIEKSNTQNYQ